MADLMEIRNTLNDSYLWIWVKAHCISCIPEQNIKGVRACAMTTCNLYPYRDGHNPRQRESAKNRSKTPEFRGFFDTNLRRKRKPIGSY